VPGCSYFSFQQQGLNLDAKDFGIGLIGFSGSPDAGLRCDFSCDMCPAALTFLFNSEKKSNKRKRRPWPKCSAGPWDGYTLVCCGLQGTTERHGAGFLPAWCYGWAWLQGRGVVQFWDGSTLMDGKKRHHQAMGGGMAMGHSFVDSGTLF
jgi:hypothetical protein